ncbi:MAG: transcriptional repressor [Ignavibacteriaceae bacterium]|nr:transcriptional repressor [Ignavibacteriaceae bacterium]
MKNKKAAEILRQFLKKGQNRITPERFEVMDAALDYEGHFGADDLYVIMKNNSSRVSRATVYKTLELLVQCNLLCKRNFGDNMTHYESLYRKQNHDHLICMDCGRIVEFPSTSLENIPSQLCNELGFDFSSYSFNIFARCKNPKKCKYFNPKGKNEKLS